MPVKVQVAPPSELMCEILRGFSVSVLDTERAVIASWANRDSTESEAGQKGRGRNCVPIAKVDPSVEMETVKEAA